MRVLKSRKQPSGDLVFKAAEPFTGELQVAMEQLGSPMIAASDKEGNIMTAPVMFEDIHFEYTIAKHVPDDAEKPWQIVREYGRFYSKDSVETFLMVLSEDSPGEAEGLEAVLVVTHINIVSCSNVKLHEKRNHDG